MWTQALSVILVASTITGSQGILQLEDMEDYSDHPCVRPCEEDGLPTRCEYDWTLELYYTMSKACYDCPFNNTDCYRPHCVTADGTSRGVLVANRQLPGPEIQVCEGDEVVVNVHNAMDTTEATTIHWHGLLQRGSPHMDGVILITQCPISEMSSFQYRFFATDPGTYWWHSHAGVQRSDGLFGHFVIRQKPSRDPHSVLYDYDLPQHVISVTDWLVEMTASRFAAHHHGDGDNKPASMLINGKGAFEAFTDPATGSKVFTPFAEFTVMPGKRYRFRVISTATLNCPIQFSIDDHTLMVINSDGSNFDPIVVDSFNIYAGERFDFVLIAHNTTQPANYWIRARGLADCNVKQSHQEAVLRYQGAPAGLPTAGTGFEDGDRQGIKLNPWNAKTTDTLISVGRLDSIAPDDDTLKEVADKKFYLAMDFNKIDNFHYQVPGLYPLSSVVSGKRMYTPQLNHISFQLPPVPLLTQMSDIDEEVFCNAETVQVDCETQYCECVHRLKVALGDVVEVIMVSESVTFDHMDDASHPMHLHGFKFRVIGMEWLNTSTSLAEVKRLDRDGQLKRKLTKAPLKDTVIVPDGGYTIIRFKADNPGVWLLHCHLEFHAIIGMTVVVQVGEPSDFPKKPKNFPVCRQWNFKQSSCDGNVDDEDEDVSGRCPNTNNSTDNTISSVKYVVVLVLTGYAVIRSLLNM